MVCQKSEETISGLMRSGIEVQVLWGMFLTLYILQPEWKIPKDQIKARITWTIGSFANKMRRFHTGLDSMVVAELVMFATADQSQPVMRF
jgi:hypothetical protein